MAQVTLTPVAVLTRSISSLRGTPMPWRVMGLSSRRSDSSSSVAKRESLPVAAGVSDGVAPDPGGAEFAAARTAEAVRAPSSSANPMIARVHRMLRPHPPTFMRTPPGERAANVL
ncbi:MAG TPA: hypothetical protein VGN26_08715 [Armatimonadota bacterium]